MKKIPTLFKRHHGHSPLVLPEVNDGCEWVLAGEGVATIKYDGTACLIRDGKLYKRFDRKAKDMKGKLPPDWKPTVDNWAWKPAPEGWEAAQDPDPVTAHWPGWMPVSDTAPEDKYHREAWGAVTDRFVDWTGVDGHTVSEAVIFLPDGTYELIGEKVQRNPYGLTRHTLAPHGILVTDPPERTFDGLRQWLWEHEEEGIVYHHPDGRMAKIRRKDFGFEWPVVLRPF